MNTNFLRRCIGLVEIISDRGEISFENLRRDKDIRELYDLKDNDLFPERTFRRHLVAIREIFKTNIAYNRANNVYYVADFFSTPYAIKKMLEYNSQIDNLPKKIIHPVEITIKVFGKNMEILQNINNKWLEDTIEEFENFLIVKVKAIPDKDFIDRILKIGDDVEIIKPDFLRKDLIARIDKIHKIYLK